MIIKFKNGYKVEVNDSYLNKLSTKEIIDRARKAAHKIKDADDKNKPAMMVVVKKVKLDNGTYKVVIIKNENVTGIKRFGKNEEDEANDFYNNLADKYNLSEEGYDDFGKTRIAATPQYFKLHANDSIIRGKRKSVKDMYEPIDTFKTFKFIDRTKQGYKVMTVYEDLTDGRMHVVAYRPEDNTYIACLGYNADNGTWNQGRYDFQTCAGAEEEIKSNYDVDLWEPDLSKWDFGKDDFNVDEDVDVDYDVDIEDTCAEDACTKDGCTKDSKKKVKDTPIEYTQELGFAVTPATIKRYVSKKDGHVLDPVAMNKALTYLDLDLDYDLNRRAAGWASGKTATSPDVITAILDKYGEFVPVLASIDDEAFTEKAKAIINNITRLENIVTGIEDEDYELDEDEDEDEGIPDPDPVDAAPVEDSEVEDVYIEDTPVGGETIHASISAAPDHAFNKTILVRGNGRALSADPKEAEYGRKLLMAEFDDVKATLEYDIAHAGDVVTTTPKYLLHMGMEKYKELIDLFNVPQLEDKYLELKKLYDKLFYNGYYLGVR